MLTRYDYLVIGFYFIFMTGMSWTFRRFIRNTSDYFRGGGEMLWWLAGAGAFMVSFSAVTFTGMAGKAYADGPVVLVIFLGNALGFLVNALWFAPVSRQTRAITAMQVVRGRFGAASEQFFTWIQIPVGTLYAGLWLMGLCVFVSQGFGMPLNTTIVITGAVVIVMALLGGTWSVIAGDFLQMLILLPVTIVAAGLALMRLEGGPGSFFAEAPPAFWHWGQAASWKIIALWIGATLLQKIVSTNSIQESARYLNVKDSRHARKAALLGMVLFATGPVVWFIPPMVARIVHPDLGAMFGGLARPQEAAYLAMAVTTLPAGMVGLLLSGIFGATMSSMDGGLNRNAGFFVKNFYQPCLRPSAGERELLAVSKAATLALGGLIILSALMLANFKTLTIFEMMTYIGGLVALPVAIPLVLGLFIRSAPDWAGWATTLVGLAASLVSNRLLSADAVQRHLGWQFSAREASDWVFLSGTLVNIAVCSGFFLLTCLMSRRRPSGEVDRTRQFFRTIDTPVHFEREEGAPGSDNRQARAMGRLSLVYGGFIALLALIPNPSAGRLAFLFCAACIAGTGAALLAASRRRGRSTNAEPTAPEGRPHRLTR